MPRIYTSTSSPLDFCRLCLPNEPEAVMLYGSDGDGPDGRGNCFDYKADHPPYQGEGYDCERCRRPLTGRDD